MSRSAGDGAPFKVASARLPSSSGLSAPKSAPKRPASAGATPDHPFAPLMLPTRPVRPSSSSTSGSSSSSARAKGGAESKGGATAGIATGKAKGSGSGRGMGMGMGMGMATGMGAGVGMEGGTSLATGMSNGRGGGMGGGRAGGTLVARPKKPAAPATLHPSPFSVARKKVGGPSLAWEGGREEEEEEHGGEETRSAEASERADAKGEGKLSATSQLRRGPTRLSKTIGEEARTLEIEDLNRQEAMGKVYEEEEEDGEGDNELYEPSGDDSAEEDDGGDDDYLEMDEEED